MNLPTTLRSSRPPSDFELLHAIHDQHRADYGRGRVTPAGQKAGCSSRFDIESVAADLGIDPASVVGRLDYHLDRQYGEPAEPGKARNVLFTPVAGKETDCVTFPLLEAVLAGMWHKRERQRWVTGVTMASLAIPLASLSVAIAH